MITKGSRHLCEVHCLMLEIRPHSFVTTLTQYHRISYPWHSMGFCGTREYSWSSCMQGDSCRGNQGRVVTGETAYFSTLLEILVLGSYRNVRIVHHIARAQSYGGRSGTDAKKALKTDHSSRMQKCHQQPATKYIRCNFSTTFYSQSVPRWPLLWSCSSTSPEY